MSAPEWPGGRPERHDVVVPVVVEVDAAGNVTAAEVEVSLGSELDEAALAAARRWTFEPALRGDRAVAARLRVAVRFLGRPTPELPRPSAPEPATPMPAPGPPEKASGVEVVEERAPAPRSASAVSVPRRVLEAAPHRTGGDLLLTVPGISITQHSGEGKAYQIFYRGFDAVHGQDIEIWAGGAPVNDVSNVHGQGYADLHFVMPELVQRIHAQPGAYDPRQGDFAVAGSLAFDFGLADPGVTAAASAGSYGLRRYFLAYRPEDADGGTFAAFEAYATDGFGPARAAQRMSAMAQYRARLSDHASLRVLGSSYASRFDSAGVLRLDDIDEGRVGRLDTYDPKQGGDSTRSQLVLEFADGRPDSRWHFTPYLVWRSLRLRSDFTGYLVDPVNGDSIQQQNDATTLGLTSSYRLPLGLMSARDAVDVGVAMRSDDIVQSQRRLARSDDQVTATPVDASVRALDTAGFVDLLLVPHRRLELRGGMRMDGLFYRVEDRGAGASGQIRSTQGVHLGKKANAKLLLADGLSALLSYGEGFRSPQARSLANGQKTPFTRASSVEAGFAYAGHGLQASLAGFRTWLSEDLVFDQTIARNEAVPGTRRTGASAELMALPTPWLASAVSATYTRAEFRESNSQYRAGDLLPYVPQWVVRTDLALQPTVARVFERDLVAKLGVGSTYLGRRPLPYAEMGHDLFIVDARAGLRLKEVELDIEALNALGAKYYDGEFVYASSFSQGTQPSLVPARHVTVGPPRIVFATLTLRV